MFGEGSVYSFFDKMKNVDHRQLLWRIGGTKAKPKYDFGWRVRELNIARNFPGTEVVIKKVHGTRKERKITAKEAIAIVKKRVRDHNWFYSPKSYKLLEPVAYAIGTEFVAMPKINAPSCEEIWLKIHPEEIRTLSSAGNKSTVTKRASAMMKELKAKGIGKNQVENAIREISLNKEIRKHNVWLLGHEKGKFIFMAFLDVR